jgi:rod shape determining protein RodA
VLIGLVIMALIWALDYHRLARLIIPTLIAIIILNLSPLLPVIGVEGNGARSWVLILGQQLQPGELSKIMTIILMAGVVSRYRGRLDSGKEYLKCLGLLAVPLITIMLQPDMGTGMVFFAIGMAILFSGGANRNWLILTLIVLALLIVAVFLLDPILDERAGHDVLLKDYQKNRLLVFLNNDIDPKGISYNLQQAKIAIGSGGLFGKGFMQGTQQVLGFLPEAPTDFVFCVLAEEFGFVGSMGLILLYAFLITVSLRLALRSDDLGALLIAGCIGMWIFQILENIGMTCGLMPITGIPLPFVSYGSSFMVVNFIALGLIGSVSAHKSEDDGGYSRFGRNIQIENV